MIPKAVSTSMRYLEANPEVILTYCDFDLIDPNSIVIRRIKAPEFRHKDMLVKVAPLESLKSALPPIIRKSGSP